MSNKSNKIDVNWLSQQIGRPSIYNIVHKIITLIERGEITAGTALPSIRVLAKELNLSSTTVATALNELKARNIIRSKPGYGTVVIDNPITAFPLRFTDFSVHHNSQPLLNLSYSEPDYILLPPLDDALKHAANVLNYSDEKYLNTFSLKELASVTEPSLKNSVIHSWPYKAENLMAFNSTYESLTCLLKLYALPGSYVAIENPTSINELDNLKRLDIKIIAVDCDQDGPIISSLAKALSKKPTLFIYQPRDHLATGYTVSKKRMADMAALFELYKTKTLIIEHDILGDISYSPAYSIGSYLPEKTIHIRSYFQTYGAHLCIALLSAPNSIIQQLYNYRTPGFGWSSHILQHTLAYLLQDKKTQLKIKSAREVYARRYHSLLTALSKRKVSFSTTTVYQNPQPHFCLWLPVESEQQALAKMASKNVIGLGGSHFMIDPLKPHQEYIRITTSPLLNQKLTNQAADAIAFALA